MPVGRSLAYGLVRSAHDGASPLEEEASSHKWALWSWVRPNDHGPWYGRMVAIGVGRPQTVAGILVDEREDQTMPNMHRVTAAFTVVVLHVPARRRLMSAPSTIAR